MRLYTLLTYQRWGCLPTCRENRPAVLGRLMPPTEGGPPTLMPAYAEPKGGGGGGGSAPQPGAAYGDPGRPCCPHATTGCPHAEYDDAGRLSGAPIIPGFIRGMPAASTPIIISESDRHWMGSGRLASLFKGV